MSIPKVTVAMRPNKVRRILAVTAVGGVLVATGVGLGIGEAHADGVISDTEYAYINTYGAGAVCPTIDEFPTEAGVMGVMAGIAEDGFTGDSAVDIINESVSSYCPRHWPLLQAIGAKARGETGSYIA
jgi:hypothetical protein